MDAENLNSDTSVEDKEGDLSFDSAQDDRDYDLSFDSAQDDKISAPNDKDSTPDDNNPDNNDEMNGHVRSLPDMVERLLKIYHLSIVGGDKILIRGKSVPIADEDVEFIKANKDKFIEILEDEK